MIDLLVYFGKNPLMGIGLGLIVILVGLPLTAYRMDKGCGLIPLSTFMVTMMISISTILPEFISHAIGENEKYRELVFEDNKLDLNLSEPEIKKLKMILASDK